MQILKNKDGQLDSDLISKTLAVGVLCLLILARGFAPLFGVAPASLPGAETILLAMGWAGGHASSYALKRGQDSKKR